MSKNDEKSNNPFAKLAAMQFPDKNAPEKARRVSVPAEKHKPSDVSFDDDERLFLASIGEVSALGFDKKVYAGFSENSCTMAELLEKTNMRKKERVSARQPEKQEGTKKKIVVDTKHEENQEDTDDFYKAMQDVKSLDGKGRAVVPCPKELNVIPPPATNPLQDFMDGKLEFALNATEDYVEGHILGMDLMTVGKLQSRQYSPEAHIDLHGLNVEQAYYNLVAFFRNSYQRGLRTVLVVTGEGKNSVNGMPILRNKVQEWFTKDPFRRVVIAFCTAKQEDGGTGALYVLIRKQKKTNGKVCWDLTPTDSVFFL